MKSKVAFLIIDMQKNCKEGTAHLNIFDEAVEYINEVSTFFRERNLPVFIIQDLEGGGPETEGFQCVEELIIQDQDIYLQKHYSNAFWQTDLEEKLRAMEVETLIISGFAAEYCVLFTYNGAIERGFKAFMLQNGVAGVSLEGVQSISKLRSVIAYDALEYFLD